MHLHGRWTRRMYLLLCMCGDPWLECFCCDSRPDVRGLTSAQHVNLELKIEYFSRPETAFRHSATVQMNTVHVQSRHRSALERRETMRADLVNVAGATAHTSISERVSVNTVTVVLLPTLPP